MNYSDLKHYLILCLLTGAAVLLDDVDLLLLRVLVTEHRLESPSRAPDLSHLHHCRVEDNTSRARGRCRPENLNFLLVHGVAGLQHSVDTVVREPDNVMLMLSVSCGIGSALNKIYKIAPTLGKLNSYIQVTGFHFYNSLLLFYSQSNNPPGMNVSKKLKGST